jgi:predicted membrane protein
MPAYHRLKAAYQKKQIFLLVVAIILSMMYLYLTQNLLLSIALGIFVFLLSFLSYCPPLEK